MSVCCQILCFQTDFKAWQTDFKAWHIGILRSVSRDPNALNMHCLIRTFNYQADQPYIRPHFS